MEVSDLLNLSLPEGYTPLMVLLTDGGITLLQGARVEGDAISAEQRCWWNKCFSGNSDPLKLVIDEGSSVKAHLLFNSEVELRIDPEADVGELIEHF